SHPTTPATVQRALIVSGAGFDSAIDAVLGTNTASCDQSVTSAPRGGTGITTSCTSEDPTGNTTRLSIGGARRTRPIPGSGRRVAPAGDHSHAAIEPASGTRARSTAACPARAAAPAA